MSDFSLESMIILGATNFVAIALVWLSYYRPQTSRFWLSVVFSASALINTHTAITNPMVYVDQFGPEALWFYSDFIYGAFIQFAEGFILLLSALQLALALLLYFGKRKWSKVALAGAAFFFLALLPLGWGAAFPAQLLFLWATVVLFLGAEKGSEPNQEQFTN